MRMTKGLGLFGTIAVALASLLTPSLAQASVMAMCGASTGKARWAEANAQWSDDRISGGGFTFTLDAKNNPNVIFRDVRGGQVDAAADGAKVFFVSSTPNASEFLIAVVYLDGAATVETYNVVTRPDGARELFWTSNRGRGSGDPKVSAFVASCR
jgi:hypothetical protein